MTRRQASKVDKVTEGHPSKCPGSRVLIIIHLRVGFDNMVLLLLGNSTARLEDTGLANPQFEGNMTNFPSASPTVVKAAKTANASDTVP